MPDKKDLTAIMGAAFIMATSAIGPGFLTQTATFTESYGASFGFVVLITTIFFIGAQLNVWRIIGVSGLRGQVVKGTFIPENPVGLIFPIITLLGGSVGGYITFAGGHRLIDAGITGEENLKDVTKSSILGISVATIVRILLFLAVFAVISQGLKLDPTNPAASAFKYGAGNLGYKFFGLVLWSASITSVIGAAYTSVSFIKTLHPFIEKHENKFIILFIFVSTLIMVAVGNPASLLILAGSLNGLILPITLGVILLASKNKEIVGEYKHPKWLLILGILVVMVTAIGGLMSLQNITQLF